MRNKYKCDKCGFTLSGDGLENLDHAMCKRIPKGKYSIVEDGNEKACPVERAVMPQTRYRLQYGGHELSFSAPMAETREQLAEILEEAAEGLKAPEDTGEFGFF